MSSKRSKLLHHPRSKKKPANLSQYKQVFMYKITYEPLSDPTTLQLPREVRSRMQNLYELALDFPEQAMKVLEELSTQYPKSRVIRNYLLMAYQSAGETEKVIAQLIENYKRDPEYLFARAAYANLLYERGDLDGMFEAIGRKMDLKLLYPERKIFHVSEVITFNSVLGTYYCATGNLHQAEVLLDVMLQVYEEHPLTEQLARDIAIARRENKSQLNIKTDAPLES